MLPCFWKLHWAADIFEEQTSSTTYLYLRVFNVSIFPDSTVKSISILRDTATAQSFILESTLPFSYVTYTGTDVLVPVIELNYVKVLLHAVFLTSDPVL